MIYWQTLSASIYTRAPPLRAAFGGIHLYRATPVGIATLAFFNNARIKQMIYASWAISGTVVMLTIVDLAIKVPFAGSAMFDILMLLGALLVGYLGWDAYRDLPS